MRKAAAIATVLLMVTVLAPTTLSITPAGAVAGDGVSSSTAAASCWAIKQSHPTSADGVYWLQTPKLVAPQQFYCDQTTDGGGWALLGRGREGWNFGSHGQGSPSLVRNTVTGTAAFTPAALPADTVDGLLNGGRVDELVDGVRIRRAANTTGTTWQEVRWNIRNVGPWSWAFGGGQLLNSINFDSTTYPISNSAWNSNSTQNAQMSSTNGLLRLYTNPESAHNLRAGFSFGGSISGFNNATSYLWEYTTENRAIPFAQVFVRPRLTAADVSYPVIPDSGAPATPLRAQLNDRPQTMPWGVTGVLKVDDPIPSFDTPVLGFAQVGSTMFVGGKFSNVTQSGGASTAQNFLAAFNVDTGEWRSDFRPVLDGAVFDLAATPQGKLIVAGNFTNINGAPNTSGVAALDPTTGAVDPTWTAAVTEPYSTSIRPYARSLAVAGNFLYIAGGFKKVAGGNPVGLPITVSRVTRVRLTDGKPDGTWKPVVNGGVVDISVSPSLDRAYIAGSFNQVNTTTVNQIAAIDATTAAAITIPWFDNSTLTEPQNVINEYSSGLYIGGSQHYIHQYDRTTFALNGSHISRSGGDFQAVSVVGNTLYASCHCTNWLFNNTTQHTTPSGYTAVNAINYLAAFDLTTHQQLTDFLPTAHAANGEGPWELTNDDRGCMWVGGDMDRGGYSSTGVQEWTGGFFRMCARDSVAPTAPTNLGATQNGATNTLGWTGSTDNSGVTPSYEVLKNDRVIATVTGATSFIDIEPAEARYFVRAIDGTTNRSATTPMLRLVPPAPTVTTLVAAGSTWSYRTDGAELGSGWNQPGYDVSSWATGPAQLGWGDGGEATVIPGTAITQRFVRTFTVANPAAVKTMLLRLVRDDGAAVSVNGIEVMRSNLPSGPLMATTPASSFVSGAAESSWNEVTIPGILLTTGVNTIAVELHQGGANNGDGSFDLELVAKAATETTLPSAPSGLSATSSDTAITTSWTASTDNQAVIGYLVTRDGTTVGFTPATTFTDTGLNPDTSYLVAVVAVDTSGNLSLPVSLTQTTDPNSALVSLNSIWKWKYDGIDPGAAWNTAGFDDSTWNSGAGELGMGDADETTVIWTAGVPTPVTARFRTSFSVANPAAVTALIMDVVRDDGVAVYINGIEVARDNLAAGAGNNTLALAAISTRAAETTPVSFIIPIGVLSAGTNTIAVEVHQSATASVDLSFALRLLASF